MVDERSRLRRRTSASSVESLGVVESSSSTGSAQSGGEPCKCHHASHIGHINKETSASERKRRERARITPLSCVSASRSRSLARSRSLHTVRFRLYFRRRTRDKNRFGSRYRSLCAGSNAIRQASPASGPLSGGPSNRQAMKLPNIFEKDATPIPFTAGQIIFEERQARDVMYVVKKGEVDIVIRSHVVETVGEDSFFGELALIDHAPRSATAIAKTDCELIKIDERQFLYLVQETPFFALIVMRTLAARIRRRNVQTLP